MAQTVLVADDSPTIQNKAKGILTGEGLEVITVSNGVAAIKKLPQVKPTLILADVSMPGRDGYEVCDFVKNSPELRHIPVLLIFSDTDPYNEEQGARVHADGKIRKMAAGKPFDPEELISTVSGFLSQAQSPTAAPAEVAAGPPAAAAAPDLVTEPTDAEPEIHARKGLDWGELPHGVAFAESAMEDVPAPAAEEPVLVEEPAQEPPPRAAHVDRTVIFRTPAELAEPRLSDDLSPAPPPPAPAAPPAVSSGLGESGLDPVAATTLESFSLSDATTGEVRFASPEADFASPAASELAAEATPESAVAPAEEAPEAAASEAAPVDADLVLSIVQKVVSRMAPRALDPDVLEGTARKLADEIMAELDAGTF